jgi:hypothetical protein
MIHRCQILKADVNRDFRFKPLSRASYASPALDNNEFATRAGPNEISSVSSGWFSPSDKPRLLLCNHYSSRMLARSVIPSVKDDGAEY